MNQLTTSDRDALVETARSFLLNRAHGPAGLSTVGPSPSLWRDIADLGWLGLGLPEECGGFGMGAVGQSEIARETAAFLLDAPLFSTVAVAAPILELAGRGDLLARIAVGELRMTVAWADPGSSGRFSDAPRSTSVTVGSGGRAVGTKSWVPDAHAVDAILVVAAGDAGPTIWCVEHDADGLRIRNRKQVDSSRAVSVVEFDSLATPIAAGATARAALELARQRSNAWLAAESLGVARRLLDVAVAHARSRVQFGRSVGEYQAVSHPLADLYSDIELSVSAIEWATVSLDQEDNDAEFALASASAMALPTGISAAEKTMQILGGLGMTWESGAHRFYKRAMAIAAFDGSASAARKRLANLLFAQPSSSDGRHR